MTINKNMKFIAKCTLKHHTDPVKNFIKGLKRHGHTDVDVFTAHQLHSNEVISKTKYDVGFCWGTRNYIQLKEYAKNVVMIENSFLDNIQSKDKFWLSFGWNGLNGRADFCNQNSPNDRWNKHFDDGRLLDYSDGDYILIPLQIKTDMSIRGLGIAYQDIVDEIRKYSDLPIRIKQHPTADDGWPLISGHKDIKYLKRFMPIHEAVKGAKVVVTINSNAGVDAVLGGKPVVALDEGSMVYDIAEHDYSRLLVPNWPDRTQWCNNIAYAQWTPDEVAAGETWEHLKQYLCTNKET